MSAEWFAAGLTAAGVVLLLLSRRSG